MKRWQVISCALFLLTVHLFAQKVISPGETLQIYVWGLEEDLSQKVTVRSDGRVFIPWVGDLEIAGKTFEEAEKEITKRLSRYFKNFGVAIAPFEGKATVSVMGMVGTTGAVEFSPGMTVAEAIVMAGGLTKEASGVVRIFKRTKEVQDVNLFHALERGDVSQNPPLQAGDILYALPRISEAVQVTVLGRVTAPGIHNLPAKAGVFTAIVAAGGVKETIGGVPVGTSSIPVSVLSGKSRYTTYLGTEFGLFDVQVSRNGQLVHKALLDASTMVLTEFPQKEDALPFFLETGDVVLVVPAKVPVAILGEVSKPGIYEMEANMTVSDLVTMAGGFSGDPYLKKSGVIRENQGKGEWIPVNLEEIFRKGDFKTNILLKPKDIVFVPKRTRRYTLTTLLNKISDAFFSAQFFENLRKLITNK